MVELRGDEYLFEGILVGKTEYAKELRRRRPPRKSEATCANKPPEAPTAAPDAPFLVTFLGKTKKVT